MRRTLYLMLFLLFPPFLVAANSGIFNLSSSLIFAHAAALTLALAPTLALAFALDAALALAFALALTTAPLDGGQAGRAGVQSLEGARRPSLHRLVWLPQGKVAEERPA